jgi:hypothetical protein
MAGPIEGNLGIALYLSTHDDQGNCNPDEGPDSLYVRASTIPDTKSRSIAELGPDQSIINAPTKTVDGDRITVTLSDSRIANNDYVCADINSSYQDQTNSLPVDDAPNYVDGFGPTNAEGLIQAMVPTGKAARIGNILDDESFVTDMIPRSPGSLSIVWSSLPTKAHPKPVVIAKGSGMIIGHEGPVKVRLTSKGRNILLDAGHSLKMSVKGTYNPTEGATVTRTKAATLRR